MATALWFPKTPAMLLASSLMLLVVFMVTPTAAEFSSWGCENYWTMPSSDNSVEDCVKNQDRQSQWTQWLWIPALPALVFAIVLVFYPIVFFCRQCCNLCGGRRRQPGVCCRCKSEWDQKSETEKDRAYTASDHCCVKCPAFVLCILSLGVIITIVRGASEAESANAYLLEDVQKNTIDTFDAISDQLRVLLSNYSMSPPAYYAPVTSDTFDSISSMTGYFQDGYDTHVNDYQKYVTNAIRIGMNCLGVIPFVFFILLPIYASKNKCRRFWPCCTTCVYFFFAIVFSLLGVLFLLLAVAFDTSSGEVSRQFARKPGVFQWYVKPYCVQQAFFDSMVDGFATSEVDYASSFCEALTKNCSSSTTYDSNNPDDNFVCTVTSVNFASVCTSYTAALSVLNNMVAKTGSPACTSCSFASCSSSCSTATQRQTAKESMYLYVASRAFYQAQEAASDLLDCDYLLDLGALSVNRGCPALRMSFFLIGFGCFFAGLLFSIGIIILFRGQKVFYKLLDPNGTEAQQGQGSDGEQEMDHQPNRV